jgi:hypothetical protein
MVKEIDQQRITIGMIYPMNSCDTINSNTEQQGANFNTYRLFTSDKWTVEENRSKDLFTISRPFAVS